MDFINDIESRYKIFALVYVVANKLEVTMNKSQRDLTSKQWFVLAALSNMKEPPTLKQLAQTLDYSHQNIRQIINKLVDKGFVKVEKDDLDQRALRIYLTDKISQWESDNQADNQWFVEEMFKDIDPQALQITAQTLQAIYQNLGDLYEKI